MNNKWFLYSVFAWCTLLFVCSCASDETDASMDGASGTTQVTFTLGAGPTQLARAYGGDANAQQGEFMNSMLVFIVNSAGVVELKIDGDGETAFQSSLTQNGKGCVTDFSKQITLTNGRKTIYAFANCEGHLSQAGNSDVQSILDNINQGDAFPKAAIDALVLSDPAAKVDLNSAFIPMSARREVSIPASSTIRVELIRLVSKVRTTLTNEQAQAITLTSFTFGGAADRVALMPDVAAPAGAVAKTYAFTGLSLPVAAASTVALPSAAQTEFYVNDTPAGTTPFSVAITRLDEDGLAGQTARTTLPRNSVLPLVLKISNLQLSVLAYVSPIGGLPVEVGVTGPSLTDQKYVVSIPEGCAFSVNGTYKELTDRPVTAWTWTNPAGSIIHLDNAQAVPLTGHVTAMPGQTDTLTFEVTAPRVKRGKLVVNTVALDDLQANAFYGWFDAINQYELVNLK